MTPQFDYAISNPPYQQSIAGEMTKGKNGFVVNIFHEIYHTGKSIAENVTIIMPGGRWMQRSTGCQTMADYFFSVADTITWFPNGKEDNVHRIFDSVMINDGVAIVESFSHSLQTLQLNGVERPRPARDEILPLRHHAVSILDKVTQQYTQNIQHRKSGRMVFGFASNWVEKHPELVSKTADTFENPIGAYLGNAISGSGKRVEHFWIDRNTVDWTPERLATFGAWKVVGTQGNVSKDPAKTHYFLVEPDHVIGESWLVVGAFDTKEEAVNYQQYISSKFARYLLRESQGGKIRAWGTFVPDLGDYTAANPVMDWSKSLDPQLYTVFGLTDAEIAVIETN